MIVLYFFFVPESKSLWRWKIIFFDARESICCFKLVSIWYRSTRIIRQGSLICERQEKKKLWTSTQITTTRKKNQRYEIYSPEIKTDRTDFFLKNAHVLHWQREKKNRHLLTELKECKDKRKNEWNKETHAHVHTTRSHKGREKREKNTKYQRSYQKNWNY